MLDFQDFMTRKAASGTANLSVQLAVIGVDDAYGLRNLLGPVVRKSIQAIVFTHVSEEVFL